MLNVFSKHAELIICYVSQMHVRSTDNASKLIYKILKNAIASFLN